MVTVVLHRLPWFLLEPERPPTCMSPPPGGGGALQDGTSVRDIYRHQWSGLREPEAIWMGLRELEKFGAIQIIEKTDTGGRHTEEILFHPDLLRAAP